MARKRDRGDDDIDLGLDNLDADIRGYRPRERQKRRPPRESGDAGMLYATVLLVTVALVAGYYLGWFEKFLMPDSGLTKPPATVTVPDKDKEYGSLKITSNPNEANVYIDNNLSGKTPYDTKSLKPGIYKVRLEKVGYHPYTSEVKIEGGRLEQFEAKLKDMNYRLTIKPTPTEAKIRLINTKEPYSPGMKLKPDKYQIEVSSPGYITAKKEFVVFDQDQELQVLLKPTGKKYKLLVSIEPTPATELAKISVLESPNLYQNGLMLVSGEYTLEVTAPGYKPSKTKVNIAGADETASVSLQGSPVKLTVTTQPQKAQIKLIDIEQAYKPGMSLMPGKYQLEVSANGYRTETQSLTLTKDQTLAVKLEEDLYLITVATTPADAKVNILAPKNLQYATDKKYKPGTYKIEVSATGYKTHKQTVELKNQDVAIDVNLETTAYAVTISTEPATARVRFVNSKVKYMPGVAVEPGAYEVEVSAKGYRTEKITFEVVDKAINQTVTLNDDRYALALISEPANATVRIVDPAMEYNATTKLNPGRYQIEVSSPGYKPMRQWVTVKDRDVEVKMRLGEEAYAFSVKTTPANAKVKILDYPDEYAEGMKLIPGRYQIEVSAEGYGSEKSWVTITDKDENVSVQLKDQQFTLTVQTIPKDAKVQLVDNPLEYKDAMPLSSGHYVIRVSKADYKPVEQPITIGKESVTIKIKLEYASTLTSESSFEPEMVVISKGSFTLGSVAAEKGRRSNEGPERQVSLAHAFAISKTEVTFAQYDVFVKETGHERPSDEGWGRANRPVINVSWDDANAYVQWLSGKSGKKYSLPSEAQWEYVAKAGGSGPFGTGECISPKQANFDGDYSYFGCAKGENRGKTLPVRSFAANKFGVFDMHGNVAEWTDDCWSSSHKRASADGKVRDDGDCSSRVLKGGGWDNIPTDVRAASRHGKSRKTQDRNLGFRVIRRLD